MSTETQQRRKLSISEHEIQVLKNAFAGNESLLKAVRKLFFGFPIDKSEADMIRSAFADAELMSAFRRKVYPIMAIESDIGQLTDYWFGTETEIVDKLPETIHQIVSSKEMTRTMFEKAFEALKDPSRASDIDMSFDATGSTDPYQVRLIARNKYIRTVETGLSIINVIAGQKSETVQEAKRRLEIDSSK